MRFTAVGEVHRTPSTDDEGKILAQPSGQQVVGKESSRDVECSPGRHAFQQAENAFGPDKSPGWYTYGGVPGTVIDLGSGRTSGQ